MATAAMTLVLAVVADAGRAAERSLRWSKPTVVDKRGGGLATIARPSARLCIAVDHQGRVAVTYAPEAHWKRTTAVLFGHSHPVLLQIACASSGLCVVVDDASDLAVSSQPTAGANAWRTVHVQGARAIGTVSCPSVQLCVAFDEQGDIITSTDPTGGVAAWHAARVDRASAREQLGGLPAAVSCPSTAFCAVADEEGNLLTSSDPTGGTAAWTVTQKLLGGSVGPGGEPVGRLSCPSTRLCVAVDGHGGHVLTSTNPAGGAHAWKRGPQISEVEGADLQTTLDFVGCPFTDLCIAADNLGIVYSTTTPTGGVHAWRQAHFNLRDVACPTHSLCVAVDERGSVRLGRPSRDPVGPH